MGFSAIGPVDLRSCLESPDHMDPRRKSIPTFQRQSEGTTFYKPRDLFVWRLLVWAPLADLVLFSFIEFV